MRVIERCGVREFVILAHFPLGPKAPPRRGVAEDMQGKSKWLRDIAEDDPIFGVPKLRRKEWHAIKGGPQSAPRKNGEYIVGAV